MNHCESLSHQLERRDATAKNQSAEGIRPGEEQAGEKDCGPTVQTDDERANDRRRTAC